VVTQPFEDSPSWRSRAPRRLRPRRTSPRRTPPSQEPPNPRPRGHDGGRLPGNGPSCGTATCLRRSTIRAATRGETDFRSQNWGMLMGNRRLGPGTLQLSGMLTMEPMTVGSAGYAHIFQLGEAYQEPASHRSAASPRSVHAARSRWRVPISKTELSISGGPVGSPAFRPNALHAPAVGIRKPGCAVNASHVRFDAHRHGHRDGRAAIGNRHGRGVRVSRAGARRASVQTSTRARSIPVPAA
jgi:hypothetical protein